MKHSLFLTSFFTTILFALNASAQTLNCNEPQDQQSMNQCAFLDWEAADGDLNLAYRIAMDHAKSIDKFSSEKPATATILRDAQRAWIPFRDKSCEAYSHLARGGTMQPLLRYGCMTKLTRQRTEQLREFGEQN